MKDLHDSEKAGAAPTAADPLNTDASSPVSSDSSNDESLPEESSDADQSVDINDLLQRMLAFYSRFVRLPSDEAYYAVILWAGHTHFMDAWDSTPRLAFLSAEPGSGKSRAMEIAALFTPRSVEASSVTKAALEHAVGDPAGTPTFFIDEIDTVFGDNAKGNEPLRGFINAGHGRRGASLKCDPHNDSWSPSLSGSYAAVAMAGIGNLPHTILSRSINIRMRKRAPGETVEPYRQRDHMHLGHALRDELAKWAMTMVDQAASLRPAMPPEIVDRIADVWEPLIIIGDLAGGVWPDRARQAAEAFVAIEKSNESPSLGVQLLAAIRTCFGSRDRVATHELIDFLLADNEAPWGDLQGKNIDPRKLAKLLKQYDIKSETLWFGNTQFKGYKLESFNDTWARLLPLVPEAVPSVTTVTDSEVPQKCEDSEEAALRKDDGCDGSVPDPDSS